MRSTTKRMFNSKKNLEYAIAAGIAVYIVFFTYPAPSFISRMLSTSTLKVLALGGICFVGAKYSVLIAAMLGLAMILSIPAREHNTTISASDKKMLEEALKKAEKFTSEDEDDKNEDDDRKEKKKVKKEVKKEDKPKESSSEPILKMTPRVISDAEDKKPEDKKPEEDDPSPISSANNLVSSSGTSGSEKFSLMNASPF